ISAMNNSGTQGTLNGVFLSQDFGLTWHQLSAPLSQVVPGNMTPVNLTLAIDPNNANIVYLAGDRNDNAPFFAPAFRLQFNPANNTSTSTSLIIPGTGPTFSDANAAHADSRAMVFDSSGRMLFAGDGGISVRNNPQGDGSWQGLNNFAAFEPYKVAYDANSKRLVVAVQDNGVSLQSRPGESLYRPIGFGDGLNAEINDQTLKSVGQSRIYTSSQGLGTLS